VQRAVLRFARHAPRHNRRRIVEQGRRPFRQRRAEGVDAIANGDFCAPPRTHPRQLRSSQARQGTCLARSPPRWTFHFTPMPNSWLNAVEGFFAILTRRRLQNGVFRSVVDLQAAINRFIGEHNQPPNALYLASKPRGDHRSQKPRVPSVGADPRGEGGRRRSRRGGFVTAIRGTRANAMLVPDRTDGW
jgi:hypothetical protein